MKAGRINRIQLSLLLACTLLFNIPAKAGDYDYTGSWILKLNALGITESDIGFGVGAEYRFHNILSLQLEAGYATFGQEELPIQSLNAYSFRPELRIYLPNPRRRKNVRINMYTGLELTMRYARTHFAEWRTVQDDQGNTFQRFTDYRTKNFTFGPMARMGMQMYFLSSRKLVADLGFGIGPYFNQVTYQGDIPPEPVRSGLDIHIFSNNKYSGIYAHGQIDLRIGYRF